MPVMNGFTATLEISKLVDTKKIIHLPGIVRYSANNEDKDDFLKKPASKQELSRLFNRFTLK
jgi:hypothetical protein